MKILRTNEKSRSKAIQILILGLLGLTLLVYTNKQQKLVKINSMIDEENKGNKIYITMDKETGKLKYNANQISIDGNDYLITLKDISWVQDDIDTDSNSYMIDDVQYTIGKEQSLNQLKINSDEAYVQYANYERIASKEILLTKGIDDLVKDEHYEMLTNNYYESNTDNQIKSHSKTVLNNVSILLNETILNSNINVETLVTPMEHIQSNIALQSKTTATVTETKDKKNKVEEVESNTTEIKNETIEAVGAGKLFGANIDKIKPQEEENIETKEENIEKENIENMEKENMEITNIVTEDTSNVQNIAEKKELDETSVETEITLGNIGTIKISNLKDLIEQPEIVYTYEDDILTIRDIDSNEDMIYITSINNEKIGCNVEDLLETNTNNVFMHKNYDNEDVLGYKTLAIVTDTELIVMKFIGEQSEELRENVFNQLNIDSQKLTIKKMQRAVDIKKDKKSIKQ